VGECGHVGGMPWEWGEGGAHTGGDGEYNHGMTTLVPN